MKEKLKEKANFNDAGWVGIKKSHLFKPISDDFDEVDVNDSENDVDEVDNFIEIEDIGGLLRKIIKPGDKVRYFPECIITFEVCGNKEKWISVLTENTVPLIIPLYALDFDPEQKKELILRRRIGKKYFETIHSPGLIMNNTADDMSLSFYCNQLKRDEENEFE